MRAETWLQLTLEMIFFEQKQQQGNYESMGKKY